MRNICKIFVNFINLIKVLSGGEELEIPFMEKGNKLQDV